MYNLFTTKRIRKKVLFTIITIITTILIISCRLQLPSVNAQNVLSIRRVNVPYWPTGTPYPSHSIFWFGKVTPTSNYADVRIIYTDTDLKVTVHIIDRLLWYNTIPSIVDLEKWDAVSLYLNIDAALSDKPDSSDYHFIEQLSTWESRDNRQAGYIGDGSGWVSSSIQFTTTNEWRGNAPNDDIEDKGWEAYFVIPFANLGFTGPPPIGSTWGLALSIHDRDDSIGTLIPDQVWPERMNPSRPTTWGQLHFGSSTYTAPTTAEGDIVAIQGNGSNDVTDAHVGGHTTCGEGIDHWLEWGEANYAGYDQVNIQNQWDIADYPCFSKYYITFPLDLIPPDRTIISATLTMHLFGNAGYIPGDAQPSAIQALIASDDWNEEKITWNNAPLAIENIALTWVKPIDFFDPGIPYSWDVSKGVADAYANNIPLRLVLYSADGDYHSGKYFWSSDADPSVRPTLRVYYGDQIETSERLYLPLINYSARPEKRQHR